MVQGAPKTEADVTFSLVLRCLPPEAVAETADFDFAPATQRGLAFRCGMTFCEAAEAGNSIGRCEDWGAHVYQTDLLLRELEAIKTCEAFVDCELNIWARRPSRTGASLTELLDQVQRLPSGTLRVGEVAVSLAARDVAVVSGDGSSEADAADGGPGMYRTLEGGEYRVMRLETPEGSPCFRYDPTRGDRAQQPAVAYLLPTNTKWRDSGSFASNQDGMARLLYQVDDDGASSPKDAAQILRECGDGPVGVPPTYSPDGGTRWPVAVPVEQLPPLASRLGLRALPARLRFALQTRTRTVLLFLLIGASPLWGGFIASQFASAYAIPSRSMEATLRVGDVVLAEKLSCRLQLPYEVDDLVLFSPPRALQELVQSAGGKPLGSRDLFVKRVAAVAGDEVSLLPDGNVAVNGVPRQRSPMACVEEQRAARPGGRSGAGAAAAMDEGAKPEARVIPDGSLFVLGDCPERSTDSRSWGPLPVKNVVARPVLRVWPLGRQGAIVDTDHV